SEFTALGTAAIGGAVIGVIMRSTGSWFFGKPVDSPVGHWFWRTIDKVIKNNKAGVVRGGTFASAFYLTLAGMPSLSFKGLLGMQFSSFSCSVALGGMTVLATGNIIKNINREDWRHPKSRLGRWLNHTDTGKNAMAKMQEWTSETQLGRFVRYNVSPGLFILGLGSGIGLIVYDYLEE
ncbi:MAG: hypothetical protein KDD40_00665, partial [Bdellovibrionales bacterium]|nr:hypothetical protein [Bdellovibrionales bacterium]